MKTVIYLVAALGLSACMDLAQAAGTGADDAYVRRQAVFYGDLDLQRQSGATALYARIRSAANVVCEVPHARPYGMPAQYRKCMSYAIARAVAEVGSPELTRLHEARTPQALPLNAQLLRYTADVGE